MAHHHERIAAQRAHRDAGRHEPRRPARFDEHAPPQAEARMAQLGLEPRLAPWLLPRSRRRPH